MVLYPLYIHVLLTRWYLKNVFNDRQARPICWKICATFENEPPAKSTAMQIRKLPAGALVPGTKGWLCQVNSFPQPGLVHTVLITTSVPICVAVTLGLLPIRQKWQNWNSSRSLDKNTMYFGSVLMLWLLDKGILQYLNKI